MRKIEIPSFLSHLKLDARGYPVPFFVPWINGKPDFRMISEKRLIECVEKKLCGICGKKLHEYQYFITGPMGLMNGTHSDPPAHRDCCEYSLQVCPHLHFEKADRNDRGNEYKAAVELNKSGILTKSPELFLIKADKFKLVHIPNGETIISSGKYRLKNMCTLTELYKKPNYGRANNYHTIRQPDTIRSQNVQQCNPGRIGKRIHDL